MCTCKGDGTCWSSSGQPCRGVPGARPAVSARQVLRWEVPVDDQVHPVGTGPVVMVASRKPGVVEVWTEELGDPSPLKLMQVFGTGHLIPRHGAHVGSTFDAGTTGLVWHLYAVGWAKR